MGRRVELIVIDDESVPAKAAEHYRRLIMSDRVDLVFSPYSSPITLAVAPIVEKAGYPMVVAGAASEKVWQQGYTSLFGLFSSGVGPLPSGAVLQVWCGFADGADSGARFQISSNILDN